MDCRLESLEAGVLKTGSSLPALTGVLIGDWALPFKFLENLLTGLGFSAVAGSLLGCRSLLMIPGVAGMLTVEVWESGISNGSYFSTGCNSLAL